MIRSCRHLAWLHSVCLGLQIVAPARAQSASPPVVYTIAPQFSGGALVSVKVDVSFVADASGRTTIELPDKWGGVEHHYRFLSAIAAEGGTIATVSPSERLITSAPRATLHLHYSVGGAYDHEPAALDRNLYAGIVVRPEWFEALGELFIVAPKGRDHAAADIAWQGWPEGWVKVGSEDHRAATVDDLVASSFLAGRGVELRQRHIPGGTLRFASHGQFDWNLDEYADDLARTIAAQRQLWGDETGDYTTLLIGLQASPNHFSSGGTGRNHGFVQYASPGVAQASLLRNIAHEYMHDWIPAQIGEMPEGDAQAAMYWLSEGFTDYLSARGLLKTGQWTPQQFVDNLNSVLFRVATSPARKITNAQVAAAFWSDNSVEQMPYDRGQLFAHLLDHALAMRHKPGLDRVLFMMRNTWRAAPAGQKPALQANFLAQLDALGFDVRPLLNRYIERGEPIALPADLFGQCAAIVRVQAAPYDPGYDRDATARDDGVVTGVDPNGPAFAAGLRNGMKRLAFIAGAQGDSRVRLTMQVRDGTDKRTISYFPAGKARLRSQEVILNTAITPEQMTGCAAAIAAN